MKNIGGMRHRATIQSLADNSPSQDAGGTPDQAWTTFSTEWMEIRPLLGRELQAAQQLHAEVTGKARSRWRAGVTAEMRILFGARVLEILAVINVEERGEEMIMLYKEGPTLG